MNRTYPDREVYYEESAHAVTEAEESHKLPSAGWGPREQVV